MLAAREYLPDGVYGIRVSLERAGDAPGVYAVVALAGKEPLHVRGKGKHWATHERVISAGSQVYTRFFGTYRALGVEELSDFAERIRGVLARPPEQTFLAELGVAIDQR